MCTRAASPVTLESVDEICSSGASKLERVVRLVALLKQYARQGLVPSPRIERPSEVHISSGTVETATTLNPDAKLRELTRVIEEVIGTGIGHDTRAVVCYDDAQSEYVRHFVPRLPVPIATIREFCAREVTGNGEAFSDVRREVSDGSGNMARDARLLASRAGFESMLTGLADACGLSLEETCSLSVSKRCSAALRGSRAISPRHPPSTPSSERVLGGFVMDPATGTHRDVHVFDYKSMYPSILASMDADATRVSTALDDLMRMRESARDRGDGPLSLGYKLLANSMYGQLGNPHSKLYDPDLANSVTREGRRLVTTLRDELERRGCTVVYGDTDSCMATSDAAFDPSQFEREFNATLPRKIRIVHERTFARLVILRKKMYVGLDRSGDFHFRGTINRRKTTCSAVSSIFERAVTKAMTDDSAVDTDGASRELDERDDGEFYALFRVGRDPEVLREAELKNHASLSNYTVGDRIPLVWIRREGAGLELCASP